MKIGLGLYPTLYLDLQASNILISQGNHAAD
jgi:hypothetical protein